MTEWQARSSCRNHPNPEWWFPETPEDSIRDTPRARAVCQTCPTRTECAAEIRYLEQTEGRQAGMWAATTAKERTATPIQPHPVTCPECQTVFQSISHVAAYCTRSCRQRAYDRNHPRNPKDTE